MNEIESRLELEKGAFCKDNILRLIELYTKECYLVENYDIANVIIEEFWQDLSYFSDNYKQQLNNYGCENVVEDITTFLDGKITEKIDGIGVFDMELKIHIETFILEICNLNGKTWNEQLSKKELLSGIEFLNESGLTFYELFY